MGRWFTNKIALGIINSQFAQQPESFGIRDVFCDRLFICCPGNLADRSDDSLIDEIAGKRFNEGPVYFDVMNR